MDYFQKLRVYIQHLASYTYQWEVASEHAELVAKYILIQQLKDDVTIHAGLPETVLTKLG